MSGKESKEFIGLNVTQAAKFLGCDRQTVRRMVQRGELKKQSDGTFLEEDLEDLKEVVGEERDSEATALIIAQLKEGHSQALDHSERMLNLIEKPLASILGALQNTIDKMNEREAAREESHIEMLELLGDILMKKQEREISEKQALEKSRMLMRAGEVGLSQIPRLFEQFAGKNILKEFVSALSAEEKAGLWELAPAFEGDKRAKFELLLSQSGVKKPEPEAGENGGNTDG